MSKNIVYVFNAEMVSALYLTVSLLMYSCYSNPLKYSTVLIRHIIILIAVDYYYLILSFCRKDDETPAEQEE